MWRLMQIQKRIHSRHYGEWITRCTSICAAPFGKPELVQRDWSSSVPKTPVESPTSFFSFTDSEKDNEPSMVVKRGRLVSHDRRGFQLSEWHREAHANKERVGNEEAWRTKWIELLKSVDAGWTQEQGSENSNMKRAFAETGSERMVNKHSSVSTWPSVPYDVSSTMTAMTDPDIALDMESAQQLAQILPSHRIEVLYSRRTAKVTEGGKVYTQAALVAVGTGTGTAGIGYGRASDLSQATAKAVLSSWRNMITIPRFQDRTLFHELKLDMGPTKLMLWPAAAHSGLCVHPILGKMCFCFGLVDVGGRVLGRRNKMKIARGFMELLRTEHKSPETVARMLGKRAVDVNSVLDTLRHDLLTGRVQVLGEKGQETVHLVRNIPHHGLQ